MTFSHDPMMTFLVQSELLRRSGRRGPAEWHVAAATHPGPPSRPTVPRPGG